MTEFRHEPALPDRPAPADDFLQTVTLLIDGNVIGTLRWHAPGDDSNTQGVVQILTLDIAGGHRRQSHGRDLLLAAAKQARDWHLRKTGKLRRMWVAVEQKHQVIARAFLTSCSFHHTTTITGVSRRQDLLVYVRAFD